MNYIFPKIKNISDVLPHIEGYNEFRVIEYEEYDVIRYTFSTQDTFKFIENDPVGSAIRRECRGLVFDKEGKLISRPYHKFFNVGENEETLPEKINLDQNHIISYKLDGSMIHPIPTKQGFVLATKSGVTDISKKAQDFILDKNGYIDLIRTHLDRNTTPIFEWISPENKIVIDYPEDILILTNIRDNLTGEYLPFNQISISASIFNVPNVRVISSNYNITKTLKEIKEWKNFEGVVIQFDNGHMVKIKSDEYVLKHNLKENLNKEKNIVNIVSNNKEDDVLPLLDKDSSNQLRDFSRKFTNSVSITAKKIFDLYQTAGDIGDKKEYSLEFVEKQDKRYHKFLYKIRELKNPKEGDVYQMLMEHISTNSSKDKHVEDVRWIFESGN